MPHAELPEIRTWRCEWERMSDVETAVEFFQRTGFVIQLLARQDLRSLMSWPNLSSKRSSCEQSATLPVFEKQRQCVVEEFVTVCPTAYGCVDFLVSYTLLVAGLISCKRDVGRLLQCTYSTEGCILHVLIQTETYIPCAEKHHWGPLRHTICKDLFCLSSLTYSCCCNALDTEGSI